jgi:mannose-6-phosphate isomerase-like protein (cupin superfamily)
LETAAAKIGSHRESEDTMNRTSHTTIADALLAAVPFDVAGTKEQLEAAGGGYEVVHASPGLEIGVYVLWAPEPDHQQPHDDDEVYVVLDGWGSLEVEGESIALEPGKAVFVPAHARHQFVGYEQLSVLVVFARRNEPELATRRAVP